MRGVSLAETEPKNEGVARVHDMTGGTTPHDVHKQGGLSESPPTNRNLSDFENIETSPPKTNLSDFEKPEFSKKNPVLVGRIKIHPKGGRSASFWEE